MKVQVKNNFEQVKHLKTNRVYKDNNYCILYWSTLGKVWVVNDLGYNNIEKLPDYIKDILISKVI